MSDIKVTDLTTVELSSGLYPGEKDCVFVKVKDDITIKIPVPLGHSVDEIMVEKSDGNGWEVISGL